MNRWFSGLLISVNWLLCIKFMVVGVCVSMVCMWVLIMVCVGLVVVFDLGGVICCISFFWDCCDYGRCLRLRLYRKFENFGLFVKVWFVVGSL